jgi:hypothetical protein
MTIRCDDAPKLQGKGNKEWRVLRAAVWIQTASPPIYRNCKCGNIEILN